MSSLVITIIAIALQALSLMGFLHYAPYWATVAPENTRMVAAALSSIEDAYFRYGSNNGGAAPVPTTAADGGLSQLNMPTGYLPFVPAAPSGFMWKYGKTTQNYVCLVSTNAIGMDEGLFRGISRLSRFFPDSQYVIGSGLASCGATSAAPAPTVFPAALTLTYFLRYVPGQSPSASALPCVEGECLDSNKF